MRKPQSFIGRLLYALAAPFRLIGWLWRVLIIAPYYEAAEALHNFRGWLFRGMGTTSWFRLLFHYLLWILYAPIWLVVEGAKWLWSAALNWPRYVRLRSLLAGLPALLVAAVAVPSLTLFHPDRNTLFATYQTNMQDLHVEASKEVDREKQGKLVDEALFYARSLSSMLPNDPAYQFSLAMLYSAKGDDVRSRAIMAELAPRNKIGYGPAHFAQAKQLVGRPMSPDDFKSAIAHFDSALRSNEVDRNEVHRELGRLYYQAYMALEAGGTNPLGLSLERMLENARDHFSKYQGTDPQVVISLGRILATQGNVEQAQLSVQKVLADLRTKLELSPSDVEARLQLAHAYASVRKLTEAGDLLVEGRIRNPDPRYDRELSNVFFAKSLEYQRNMPSAKELPFQALRSSFEANPGNGLTVAGFLQALLESEERANFARKTLTDLPPPLKSHPIVQFLLGFDAQRRSLPQIADQHFAAARNAEGSLAPAVFADIANVAMERGSGVLSPQVGHQLCESALRLWPTHPDLLYLRAKVNLQSRRYAEALADLNKAVAARQNDATLTLRLANDVRLNALLAAAYQSSGQQENAERHKRLAQAAAALKEPLK